ncbi:adenosine deaminase [Trypanosoma grayi]|uniref:adenosine deaminase n=1 Tax=Trypanosoma grayi TaxID=71804 RepID=UPI0004F4246E|nr:adenosine deaminase [Trypanosoma grayi]KEG07238.1 adenosine deaminase [Trypanosoma grayi]
MVLSSGNGSDSCFSFGQVWATRLADGHTPTLRGVPKVDLHCHLNGSISAPLLAHLESLQQRASGAGASSTDDAAAHGGAEPPPPIGRDLKRAECIVEEHSSTAERMQFCFSVFSNIYKVMNNIAFARLAVQDLLIHSAAENMFALEIRTSLRHGLYTTPSAAARGVEAERVTKKTYLETVIGTVEHLMYGGLVDLVTGELLPIGGAVPAAWWSYFVDLYGSLISDTVGHADVKGTPAVTVTREAAAAFLEAIQTHMTHRIHIRLLVSINRGDDVVAANEAVMLAKELQREQVSRFFTAAAVDAARHSVEQSTRYLQLRDMIRRSCWVSGIDFSGHCAKNHFRDFRPALEEARRGDGATSYPSLGITLHAGEKDDAGELAEMVAFAPERWGHLVFTDPANLGAIIARHDAIELCISSNALTGGYTGVARHHLGCILEAQQQQKTENGKSPDLIGLLTDESSLTTTMRWREKRRLSRWLRQPEAAVAEATAEWTAIPNVSFHTDDRGVFATSVTKELEQLLQHGSMTGRETADMTPVMALWALQRLAVPHMFELPLEVVYFCTRMDEYKCDSTDACSTAAQLTARVAMLSDAERAKLSRIELGWLLGDFDDVGQLTGRQRGSGMCRSS